MGTFIKKYMWIGELLAVLVTSFLLAKLAVLFIAGQFPDQVIASGKSVKQMQSAGRQNGQPVDTAAILKRNFFDPEETADLSQKPVSEDVAETVIEESPDGVAVRTSLDIKLLSTVSVGDGRNELSSAVIESGRKTGVYFVNGKETFAANARVTRILTRRVEFLNAGKLEFIELEDIFKGSKVVQKAGKPSGVKKVTQEDAPGAEIQGEDDKFTIPRSEVDKALANLNKLYTDIRGVPYFKDGKAGGIKLLSVKVGSLFEKLGLRRGDILKAINGNVLDIQSGLQLFNQLKNESSFQLQVERRGAEKSLSYEII